MLSNKNRVYKDGLVTNNNSHVYFHSDVRFDKVRQIERERQRVFNSIISTHNLGYPKQEKILNSRYRDPYEITRQALLTYLNVRRELPANALTSQIH